MALVDVQAQLYRIGKIKLGTSEPATSRDGKEYRRPVKLGTFRLVSPAKGVIDQAAALYGGVVEPWENQWAVTTDTNSLPVTIPPQDPELLSFYQLWKGSVQQRSCDGAKQANGKPCVCDPERRANREQGQCIPRTTLRVTLPDIPGIGLWWVESSGVIAASELYAAVKVIYPHQQATGEMVPATLILETVDSGQKHFVKPTVHFTDFGIRDLVAGSGPKVLGAGGAGTPPPALPPPSLDLPAVPDSPITVAGEDVVPPEPVPVPSPAPGGDVAGDALEPLLAHLAANTVPGAGTAPQVEARTRELFRLMADAGLWGAGAFHAAIKKHLDERGVEPRRPGEVHWADLGVKVHQQEFAIAAFDAARKRMEQ